MLQLLQQMHLDMQVKARQDLEFQNEVRTRIHVLSVKVDEVKNEMALFYSLRDTPPAHQWEAACMR